MTGEEPHIPIADAAGPASIVVQADTVQPETVTIGHAPLGDDAIPKGHSKTCKLVFREGDTSSLGTKIGHVIHSGNKCVVFITPEAGLAWHAHDECIDSPKSTEEACDLQIEMRATIDNKAVIDRGVRLIAISLARALEQKAENDTHDYFANARSFIETRRRESLHMRYLAAALLTCTLIGGLCAVIANVPLWLHQMISVGAGALGALVSVYQRFRNIPIEKYASSSYTVLAGATRIVFGSIFGFLVFLLQSAELAFVVVLANVYLLAVIAFVAGFSERKLPELIERFESHLDQRTGVDDGLTRSS